MDAQKQRLDSVEKLNNSNIERSNRRYTGKTIIHWLDGEPLKINIDYSRDIRKLK